jgi:hypothetical protein
VRGGAVILLEADHLGAGEVLLELEDVLHLRAAPRIDRLVVVADAADVLALLGEQAEPEILDAVGVLILVDHDVAEALLVSRALAIGLEDREHVEQQVAEIAGVERLQPLLIGGVERLALAVGIGSDSPASSRRGQALVLPIVDQPGELARGPALLVEIGGETMSCLSRRSWSSVSRMVKFDLQPDQLGMAAEHLGADRVEGAEPGHALDASPTRRPTRSFISRAALLVKVTARISRIGFARPERCARRAVSAAVLPVPAPARTSTGPSVVSTASRWGGFRPADRGRPGARGRGDSLVNR